MVQIQDIDNHYSLIYIYITHHIADLHLKKFVVGARFFINLISTKIELLRSFFQNKQNEYQCILNSFLIIRQ